MDRFITTGTKLIPENEVDRRKMVIDFKKALDISWEIFGNDSFRKRQSINDGRKPINKPLFEIISTVFSKLTDDETRELLKNKKEFVTSFIELQNDNKRFWNAITTGTATKDNVNLRNKEFSAFLSNFIK